MVAFGHTAVGALIGLGCYKVFGNNIVLGSTCAVASGIASHYVADAIPHGHFFKGEEYKQKIIYAIIFDVFLSVLIFLSTAYLPYFSTTKLIYTFWGITGSQLPDVLDGLVYTGFLPKKGFVKRENALHKATHWHGSLLLSWMDLWQLTVVLISLYFVFITR